MATDASIGYGTIFRWAGVQVAEVFDLKPPELSRTIVDVTHYQSPNRWMEFIKGLKDGGSLTIQLNWDFDDPTHDAATGILSDFADDSSIAMGEIEFPDGTTWSAPMIVEKFAGAVPINDRNVATVTVKIAGQPTLA